MAVKQPILQKDLCTVLMFFNLGISESSMAAEAGNKAL